MRPVPAWLTAEKKYLLGISGGRDSVFLLHWLLENGIRNLVLCHLHHGLRGEEAQRDADFVDSLASTYQLPVVIGHEDVQQLAQTHKQSLETAARHARHQFFAHCASSHGTSDVLLGHHADDQAETILFRLLRGSAGAKGMQAQQVLPVGDTSLTLLRPLLDIRRSDITSYLTTHGIEFCEDATNQDPFAARNRLRNEALPLLAEIMGRDPTEPLIRAAHETHTLEQIAAYTLAQEHLLDPQGRIHLPTFRELPPALQRYALHDYLKSMNIADLSSELINDALSLSNPDSPPSLNLPGGLRLRRKESRLFISS